MELKIKVNKLIDLMKSKFMIKFKQNVFKGENYNIKYVLETNKNSEVLIVVFTACTQVGQPARYNYVRTLDKYKCNKLFILDDFGFDSRGAYYLGSNKDFNIEKDVDLLIKNTIDNINTKKNIFVGSSKGGYAALYFGLSNNNSIIITGAPQYKLGNYLNLPGHKDILTYIMGDTSKESINYLNKLMENRIKENNKNNNLIYIHYSINEENYANDMEYLMDFLKEEKVNVKEDVKYYKNHSDLTQFFPSYINEVLDKYVV